MRRDVDMQLFSLIINASLCITASCHARSGPGNGGIPAPLNSVIIEMCHYYSLPIVYTGNFDFLFNGVKMLILKISFSFINFPVKRNVANPSQGEGGQDYPSFSPSRRLYEPEASFPIFHL